ncbi:hypothetical protein VNO77_27368 [Canavalia gladiata]|uniref:Uncharacterized protein n=1 Tax=Canavalia gladiata TaxID=3824 RepID=A0AAN9Q6F1_CANGL
MEKWNFQIAMIDMMKVYSFLHPPRLLIPRFLCCMLSPASIESIRNHKLLASRKKHICSLGILYHEFVKKKGVTWCELEAPPLKARLSLSFTILFHRIWCSFIESMMEPSIVAIYFSYGYAQNEAYPPLGSPSLIMHSFYDLNGTCCTVFPTTNVQLCNMELILRAVETDSLAFSVMWKPFIHP